MPDQTTHRGDRTRARLVNAAMELMADQGWSAVTTRSVADRAGVNQALVHYHFHGVDDLRRRAALHAVTRMGEEPARIDPGETLAETGAKAVRGLAAADPDAPEVAATGEAMMRLSRDPDLREQVLAPLRAYRTELTERVRAAQENGALPTHLSPEAVAAVVAATLDGLLLHHLLDPGIDLDAAADVLRAFLGGDQNAATDDPE